MSFAATVAPMIQSEGIAIHVPQLLPAQPLASWLQVPQARRDGTAVADCPVDAMGTLGFYVADPAKRAKPNEVVDGREFTLGGMHRRGIDQHEE